MKWCVRLFFWTPSVSFQPLSLWNPSLQLQFFKIMSVALLNSCIIYHWTCRPFMCSQLKSHMNPNKDTKLLAQEMYKNGTFFPCVNILFHNLPWLPDSDTQGRGQRTDTEQRLPAIMLWICMLHVLILQIMTNASFSVPQPSGTQLPTLEKCFSLRVTKRKINTKVYFLHHFRFTWFSLDHTHIEVKQL